jgi:hypothetical protein
VFLGLSYLLLAPGHNGGHQSQAKEEATATPTAGSNSATAPVDVFTEREKVQLAERARGLLKAYYLLKPNDTTEIRRARVAPFVPEKDRQKYLAGLGLGVSTDTQADKARIDGGWIQRAKLVDITTIGKTSYDRTIFVVGASLNVSMTAQEQRVGPNIPARVATLWQKQSGKWVLVGFKEGGTAE